jgi:hypothetical protein
MMYGIDTYGSRAYGEVTDDGTKSQDVLSSGAFTASSGNIVFLLIPITRAMTGSPTVSHRVSLLGQIQAIGGFVPSVIGRAILFVFVTSSGLFLAIVSLYKKLFYAVSKSAKIKPKMAIIDKTRRL